ncbi:Reverse transcriptase domain-containing protein [Aphis craccivora]|uniref:Reverse transcriptase domain-containing protein n=1 Tax=Aphis craccivora TaxID=307492 RepID=A0A6G0VUF8_APHCR|nr:Reverse transcriptase domain-containing protein [Aphis craccivora]
MILTHSKLESAVKKISVMENKIEFYEQKCNKLEKEVIFLKGNICNAEQASLINNIEISGVPKTANEDVSEIVKITASVLNCEIKPNNILHSFRGKSPENTLYNVHLYEIQSGTEEKYGEKCQLLQEISDMYRDFNKKQVKNTKSKKDKNEGYRAKINATQGYSCYDIELENESLTDMSVDNNNYSIFRDIKNEDIPNILNIETSTAVNDDTITQNNMIEVTLDNVPNPIDTTCIDIPSTSKLGNY